MQVLESTSKRQGEQDSAATGRPRSWRSRIDALPQISNRPCFQSRALRLLVVILIAIAFTSLIIQYSFRHGRLITFLSYDDIAYASDGLRRLQKLYDSSITKFLKQYRTQLPHSPYSTFLATASFAVFGVHDWAPYAGNVLLIFAYFAFADFLFRGMAMWQKLLGFALLASFPLVGFAAHEFRPDHAAFLMQTIALILLIKQPWQSSSWRHHAAVGLFCGLGILFKPPTFIGALLLLGWGLLLSLVCDRYGERRWNWRAVLRSCAICLGTCVLVALPYFAFGLRDVLDYIYINVFGDHKDVWQVKAGLGFHLNYYLLGQGGQVMLGGQLPVIPAHLLVIILLLLAGLAATLIRGRKNELLRAASLVLLIIAAYLMPALMKNKQVFFGLGFHTLIMFAALMVMRDLLLWERVRQPKLLLGSAGLIAISLFGVLNWTWPTRWGSISDEWIKSRNALADGIFQGIANNGLYSKPTVMINAVGEINGDLLGYFALKEHQPMRFTAIGGYSVDLQEYDHAFDNADLVLAAEKDNGLLAPIFPSLEIQNQLIARLRARKDYRLIGSFIYSLTGKGFYLFLHQRGFGGWQSTEHLGPLEGPFPKDNLGHVRWGFAPGTRLKLTANSAGTYKLDMTGRAASPNETIKIRLDGKVLKEVPVGILQFESRTITFDLNQGNHELELEYRNAVSDGHAVLFDRLLVNPAD